MMVKQAGIPGGCRVHCRKAPAGTVLTGPPQRLKVCVGV